MPNHRMHPTAAGAPRPRVMRQRYTDEEERHLADRGLIERVAGFRGRVALAAGRSAGLLGLFEGLSLFATGRRADRNVRASRARGARKH
jgi:hypothetical protein